MKFAIFQISGIFERIAYLVDGPEPDRRREISKVT
jgi:hypothetical protein